jgi:hypothetical protein
VDEIIGEAWGKTASISDETNGVVPLNPNVIPNHFIFRYTHISVAPRLESESQPSAQHQIDLDLFNH